MVFGFGGFHEEDAAYDKDDGKYLPPGKLVLA